jgi:hypothetical protein
METSGTTTFLGFFQKDGWYVAGLAIASLIYLLVDFFIVIKRFKAILQTGSFWLFWFCISVLNLLAFEALRGAQDAGKKGSFGDLQGLALIIMSTLGTAAVLQSFALKIGDRSVVDVSKVISDFRAAVLQAISRQQAKAARDGARKAAEKLEVVFKNEEGELREAFIRVMSFAGRTSAEVQKDLQQIADDASALKIDPVKLLAQRIAQADASVARQLWLTKVNRSS